MKNILGLSIPAVLMMLPALSFAEAQNSTQQVSADSLTEIVVTALRTKQDLQKSAAAIDVVTADALRERGVTDIFGLSNLVPSLEINWTGPAPQIFMRGIGQNTYSPGNSPGIAVNFDGVYNTREAQALSLFDLEQVEVLPGPQGLLYGRNAAGGVVNVVSRLPGDTFDVNGLAEVGNYSMNHVSFGTDIPLSDDLKLRAAIDRVYHKGYLSNGLDDADSIAGRLTAVYSPNEDLRAVLRTEYDYDGGRGGAIVPYPFINKRDPWYDPTYGGDHFFNRQNTFKINAEVDYYFNAFSVTYIPAYISSKNAFRAPIGSIAAVEGEGGTVGYFALVGGYTNPHRDQYSNELRFTSNSSAKSRGDVAWVGGVFQNHAKATDNGEAGDIYNPAVFTGGSAMPYLVSFGDRQNQSRIIENSYSAFSQVTYSVLDPLRVLAGLRYSVDDRHGTGLLQTYLPATPLAAIPFSGGALVDYQGVAATPAAPFDLTKNDTHLDWKVGIEADVGHESLLYANVQTGYIQGGFNFLPVATQASTFNKQTLLAYTVGAKNTLDDGKLRINVEAFYYDYKDLQVSAYAVETGSVVETNVPKSSILGAQLDGAYRILEGTTLEANIGWLDAKIKKGVFGPSAVYACAPGSSIPAALCSGSSMINYAGNPLPYAPPLSATLGLSKLWGIASGGSVEARVETKYNDGSWTTYAKLPGQYNPSYTKTDVTLTYNTPSEKWAISAWLKNAENTAYLVSKGTDTIYGQAPGYLDPPRTFGLRVVFKGLK